MSTVRDMIRVHVRCHLAAQPKTAGTRFARQSASDAGRSIPKLHRTKWTPNPRGGGL